MFPLKSFKVFFNKSKTLPLELTPGLEVSLIHYTLLYSKLYPAKYISRINSINILLELFRVFKTNLGLIKYVDQFCNILLHGSTKTGHTLSLLFGTLKSKSIQ